MLVRRAFLGGLTVVTLLLSVAAFRPALAPAASSPLVSAVATAVASRADRVTELAPDTTVRLPTPLPRSGASPAGAAAGSAAALAQAMLRLSDQLPWTGDDSSDTHMRQVMDQLATKASSLAPSATQATQGTPDLRQMAALTLNQTGILARQLRDASPRLSPQERTTAMRQMQTLAIDVAQVIAQVQDISDQSSLVDQQSLMARMQALLGAMRSMTNSYHLSS